MNRNACTLYLQGNKEKLVKLVKRRRNAQWRKVGQIVERLEERLKKLKVLLDWGGLCRFAFLCQGTVLS